MPKHPSHILELAKRGAEVQFRALVQDAKYLIELFPHLRDSLDNDELPVSFILKKGAGRAATKQARGRRRKMTAAARKALSERMKKVWAARRKA